MKRFMTGVIAFLSIYACNNGETTDAKPGGDSSGIIATDTPAVADPAMPVPYSQELKYKDIGLVVSAPQAATGNEVTVTPSGLSINNDPVVLPVDGIIVKSEAEDIDGDDSPEILVVTQTPDKRGHAYMFTTFNKKSMGMVNLPDFTENPELVAGYGGMDEFALVESSLVRRFPLFENGNPSGKTRQLQYKLKPGEAMKQLVLSKTTEY